MLLDLLLSSVRLPGAEPGTRIQVIEIIKGELSGWIEEREAGQIGQADKERHSLGWRLHVTSEGALELLRHEVRRLVFHIPSVLEDC